MKNNEKKNEGNLMKPKGELKYTFFGIITILLFLMIWQSLVAFEIVNTKVLAAPSEVFALFFEKMGNPNPEGATLPQNILASLQVTLMGFFIGVGVGIPLGLLMGWYKPIDKFVRPLFEILRPIPPVAWIPLSILWLGYGLGAKAAIIFFAAFIPSVINCYTGIKLTDKTRIAVAKTCGASNFQTFLKVGVPSALPLMFAGLRISLGAAWRSIVAAEMLAANAGLGYMIVAGRQWVRIDLIILGIIVIGLIGYALTFLLEKLEKYALRWRLAR